MTRHALGFRTPAGCKVKGFTIVEMMVGITISLILLGGVIQVLATNKQVYLFQEQLSRLQENGRFAMEVITRDIRMAGFMGCAKNARVANSVNGGGLWMYDSSGIFGYEGGVDTFPSEFASDVVAGTDSVVVRRGGKDDVHVVSSHDPDPAVATVYLTQNHNLKKGEVLLLVNADCSQIGIFQMSNINPSDTISVVVHNTGGPPSPGNCTQQLQGSFTCADTSTAVSKAYEPGSALMRMSTNAYYVGLSNGIPALFREALTHSGGSATTQEEEVVRGVENLQILYGVDSDATADGVANQYVAADQIPLAGHGWDRVVALRVHVLMRTTHGLSSGPQNYTYMGATVTPATGDRFLRREFKSTIQIRNKGA